jgi:organic hydroperoxide reductase OsmC/OhrA
VVLLETMVEVAIVGDSKAKNEHVHHFIPTACFVSRHDSKKVVATHSAIDYGQHITF